MISGLVASLPLMILFSGILKYSLPHKLLLWEALGIAFRPPSGVITLKCRTTSLHGATRALFLKRLHICA